MKKYFLILIGIFFIVGTVSAMRLVINANINNQYSRTFMMQYGNKSTEEFDSYDLPTPPMLPYMDAGLYSSVEKGVVIDTFERKNSRQLNLTLNMTENLTGILNMSWNFIGENYSAIFIDYGTDENYINKIDQVNMKENFSYVKNVNNESKLYYFQVQFEDPCMQPLIGNWILNCSYGCVWNNPINVSGNITFLKSGTIRIENTIKLLTHPWKIYKDNGCTIEISNGGSIE